MSNRTLLFSGLALLSATSPAAMAQETPPAYVSRHETRTADTQAIQRLLATYTGSVTSGDQAAFKSLLLNEQIPFSSTDAITGPRTDGADTRHYASFGKAVFLSGARYTEKFYNVHIQQDGPLAQVSLDFVTRKVGGGGSYGWKLLQLIKIGGQWKIGSALYTARSLPTENPADGAPPRPRHG